MIAKSSITSIFMLGLFLLIGAMSPTPSVAAFSPQPTHRHSRSPRIIVTDFSTNNDDKNDDDGDKFSMAQRLESIKCVIVGALTGGVAITPVAAIHDIVVQSSVPQWEFDTDTGSLEAALFAIVYRYCVRTDINPMLNQGVIGAFCLTRTISRIHVPSYCSAIPLNCGAPIGYLDWSMIQEGLWSGLESVALFGSAAYAMNYCFQKGYISKFP